MQVPAGDAFASVFLDRLLGILSLLMMALAGLGHGAGSGAGPRGPAALVVTALVCAAAAAAIFSRRAAQLGDAVAGRLPWARAQRATSAVVVGLQRYAAERRILRARARRIDRRPDPSRAAGVLPGARAGIALPLTSYFAFLPVILLVMLLPISVNGLGTSQIAFVGLFSRGGCCARAGLRAVGAVPRRSACRQPAGRPAVRIRPR